VVTTDQKDFSAILTSIRAKNPQALFIGAEEVEAGLIAKQARELGLASTFVGAAPLATNVYAETAGQANVEGSIVSTPYLSNEASEATKTFAAAYQKAYGEAPELHGAKAYDGAEIFLAALKSTGGKGGKELADAIRATQHDGLLGDFKFDETGVGIHETQIGQIKAGKLVPAE
jgi:branched-chain amino acid transport system substrate-binding protein